jgi:hypothetical protein
VTPTKRFSTLAPDVHELRALAAAVVKNATPVRSGYRPRYELSTPPVAEPARRAPTTAPQPPRWRSMRASAPWALGAAVLFGIVAAVSVIHRMTVGHRAAVGHPTLASLDTRAVAAPASVPAAPEPSAAALLEDQPEVEAAVEDRPPPPPARTRHARSISARTVTEEETEKPSPAGGADAEKPEKNLVATAGHDQVDDLVKKALEGTETRGDKRAEDEALPPLTREEIKAAMKVIQPRIKDCYRQFGQKGIARVRVEVGDGGEVASTTVEGNLAHTPTSACVESAVAEARFPASAGMTFRYPFPVR